MTKPRSPQPSSKGGPARRAFLGLGMQMGRHAAVYGLGAFLRVFLSLVTVAVVTRFLDPAAFGRFSLLLLFSAGLTILYNLGSLQGTFMRVFGSTGEEEIEDDDSSQAESGGKRRALGTGLILTVLISVGGTVALLPMYPRFSELLLGNPDQGELVLIAAIAGALGAVVRLSSNVVRLERRPRAFLILSVARPTLVLAAVVPLVASGRGVGGAITGVTIGTAAVVAASLIATRPSYELRFSRLDTRVIMSKGFLYAPILISLWIAGNVDTFVLSGFASDEDVGLYRVASRVGAVLSYFTSALILAWQPLRNTITFAAAEKSAGSDVVRGSLVTYFLIGGTAMLVAITVAADTLVRIAPPAYSRAAPLIPVLAGGFLAQGGLLVLFRAARFKQKRIAFMIAALLAAVIFFGSALVLIPLLGASGAAISVILGFSLPALGMAILSQRGPQPFHIQYGRIARVGLLAAACLIAAELASDQITGWRTGIDLAALVAFVVLVPLVGAIPRHHLSPLLEILRAVVRPRPGPEVKPALRTLDPEDRGLLELAIVHRWTVQDIALSLARGEQEVAARLARALRKVVGRWDPTDLDAGIGAHLFSQETVAERDAAGRDLVAGGASPTDIHAVETALRDLESLRRDAWRERGRVPPSSSDGHRDGYRPQDGRERAKAARSPQPFESSFEGKLKYIYEPPPSGESPYLLVNFSSFRPGRRFVHPQILREAKEANAHKLVVRDERGYFIGTKQDPTSAEAVVRLLDRFIDRYGIERENVTAAGSSFGGMAALHFGLKCGFGRIIVGTPIVSFGEMASGPDAPSQARAIAKRITGESGDRAREFFDGLVFGEIEKARSRARIEVLTCTEDPYYEQNVPPLVEAVEQKENLDIEVKPAKYGNHRWLGPSFAKFLGERIGSLVEESSFEGTIKYIYERPTSGDSPYLIVNFSSYRPGRAYNRPVILEEVRHVNVHKLMLRDEKYFFIGPKGNLASAQAVERLIDRVIERHGIDRKNVIATGTSVGGLAALRFGLKCGFGRIIVGTPIVSLGEMVSNPDASDEVKAVAEQLTGKSGDWAREFFDRFLFGEIEEASARSRIEVFTCVDDPYYKQNVPRLVEAVERNENLGIDVKLSTYGNHRWLGPRFASFLWERMAAIIKPESTLAGSLKYMHMAPPPGGAGRHLVVNFSSFRPDGYFLKGHSRLRRIRHLDSHLLSFRDERDYFLGHNRDSSTLQAWTRFLNEFIERHEIPRENVISCGSSFGGKYALVAAMTGGFGHAIVGTPIASVTDFARTFRDDKELPTFEIIRHLTGGTSADDLAYLDSVVFEPIARAEAETTVHLFTSEIDPVYEGNIPRLLQALDANDRLSVEVTLDDHDSHARMVLPFEKFLASKLEEIIGEPAPPAPEAPPLPELALTGA